MSAKHTQPEALRLADELDAEFPHYSPVTESAAELRRQHELIVEMREALKAVKAWDVANLALDIPLEIRRQMQAAISKAEGQQ